MPAPAPAPLRILHLGLGAFHRAHQAVYLQRLIDNGDARWSLASGNIRPDGSGTLEALARSGGAYTLETVTPAGERSYQRISSIATVVPWDKKLSAFVNIGAEASTRIVSFTVTEAGYSFDGNNRLDLAAADVAADLAALRAGGVGSTVYGALHAILRARMHRGAGAVTLLCCDNLRHNGEQTGAALLDIRRFAFDYATNDVIPVLSPSPLDLPAYRDTVLERFGNAAILDTNQRVAADSFAKIPAFIAPHGARPSGARGKHRVGRNAAGTVPGLPAPLARGNAAVPLPGPGHGPSCGACHLRLA
jgi:mannitol-1-phosphate/altronate dehydrogenase